MRCKACDVILFDYEDLELCDKCLSTTTEDYSTDAPMDNSGDATEDVAIYDIDDYGIDSD